MCKHGGTGRRTERGGWDQRAHLPCPLATQRHGCSSCKHTHTQMHISVKSKIQPSTRAPVSVKSCFSIRPSNYFGVKTFPPSLSPLLPPLAPPSFTFPVSLGSTSGIKAAMGGRDSLSLALPHTSQTHWGVSNPPHSAILLMHSYQTHAGRELNTKVLQSSRAATVQTADTCMLVMKERWEELFLGQRPV